MQVLVVGAGVVGLAVARAVALAGHEVIVAEAAAAIGTGVSSRNSEVIHAGLYYPTGSKRAYHCPRSRRMLYEFCATHGVPHRKCGKLVVATNEAEAERLDGILKQSQINGVEGVEIIDGAAATRLEPALACVAAMYSPETGIIDSHRYMLALEGELEDHGGMIAFNTRSNVWCKFPTDGRLTSAAPIRNRSPSTRWSTRQGSARRSSARATEGYPQERVPRLFLGKGNYFGYAGRPVFSRLIYPAPIPGGLGVHVTLDLAGRMRFGPDVEWTEHENYDVDPARAQAFYARIRDVFAGPAGRRAGAGLCRHPAEADGPGRGGGGFHDRRRRAHGRAALVHPVRIELPG